MEPTQEAPTQEAPTQDNQRGFTPEPDQQAPALPPGGNGQTNNPQQRGRNNQGEGNDGNNDWPGGPNDNGQDHRSDPQNRNAYDWYPHYWYEYAY